MEVVYKAYVLKTGELTYYKTQVFYYMFVRITFMI